MNESRFTVSISAELHADAMREAERRGLTMASFVRQSVKLILAVLPELENPNKSLIHRETIEGETRETRLFIG